MPFKSEKQRRFMYAKHPDIAKRWASKYGGAIKRRIKKNAEHKAVSKED